MEHKQHRKSAYRCVNCPWNTQDNKQNERHHLFSLSFYPSNDKINKINKNKRCTETTATKTRFTVTYIPKCIQSIDS